MLSGFNTLIIQSVIMTKVLYILQFFCFVITFSLYFQLFCKLLDICFALSALNSHSPSDRSARGYGAIWGSLCDVATTRQTHTNSLLHLTHFIITNGASAHPHRRAKQPLRVTEGIFTLSMCAHHALRLTSDSTVNINHDLETTAAAASGVQARLCLNSLKLLPLLPLPLSENTGQLKAHHEYIITCPYEDYQYGPLHFLYFTLVLSHGGHFTVLDNHMATRWPCTALYVQPVALVITVSLYA